MIALRLRLPLLFLAAGLALAQTAARPDYDLNYIGPPMADPVMQHSKETYVLFGCSYCHGIYLVARGEATDLMHSRLVGRDENGSIIGPLLRTGIPQTAKLSPMPQFSDLSDLQIADLVRWIHYARAQGRYKELMEAKESVPGAPAAGQEYFAKNCSSCHSATGDLAGIAGRYNGPALKAHVLRPALLDAPPSWRTDRLHDAKSIAARQRHQALLENYTASEVADMMAWIQTLK